MLVILLTLEVGVFRQRWFWAAVPRSDAGIYYVLEDQIRHSHAKPKVILFGDSRMRSGVDARLLEQELGLERGEVLNLALTAGTAWDAKLFLRRNPGLRDSVRLIIFQPSDWQFNENFPPINRVKHFATLKERLEYQNFSTASELVAGWFVQTIAAKDVFQGHVKRLLSAALNLVRGRKASEPALVDTLTGRIHWRIKEEMQGPDSADITKDISSFYKNFSYSRRAEEDARDIIEFSEKHGARTVFLDIPVRDAYVEAAKKKYAAYYEEYEDSLETLASRYGVPLLGDSMTKLEAGIKENLYYDYGHLTLEGERLFTLWLAERIKSDSLLR